MISALAWIEETALSQWVVGSLWAFPVILTFHALGMGVAVGLSAMIDLRILGAVGRGIPLVELRKYLPILWAGFWVNLVSGVLLLIGYPTKALTNPVFYLKILLIIVAMLLLPRIARRAFGETADEGSKTLRRLAMVSLACWVGAITAGRFLAYTYLHLTASDF